MQDVKELYETVTRQAPPRPNGFERMLRRRDRKRRNQRIAAGVVGIAAFVAAIWIVTSVASLDRSEKSVVPAGTGPAVTGPAVTGPTVPEPREAIGPVPKTDYLLDLDTGETTPLPESIVGAENDNTGEYAASPDGSRLAYSAPGDNGKSQIFVANLDGTGVEQVSHDLEAAFSPAWSPDGSKIAYVGQQGDDPDELSAINTEAGNIFVLDLATGTSTQLTFTSLEPDPAAPEFGPWGATLPSLTEDGSSIVFGASRWEEGSNDHGEYEARTVPVAGGESVRLMGGEFRGLHSFGNARPSPDGSHLTYSCQGWFALCIANADGTDERELARPSNGGSINAGSWSPDGTRIPYFEFYPQDVFILDVATGQATYVAEGWWPTWLDDHTLVVEISQRCYNRASGGWGMPGCPG